MLHFSNIRVRPSVSARRRRSGALYRLVALVGALAVLGLGAAPATAQTAWIARSGTQDVVRIDTTTNTLMPGSIPLNGYQDGVLATASRVYFASRLANAVSVIDTATGTVVDTISLPGAGPARVAISPDGTRLFTANFDNDTVSVINATTHDVIRTLPTGDRPGDVAVSPDGATVYVTNQLDNTVHAIAVATGALIDTYTGFASPSLMALSPNGATAYVVNTNTSSPRVSIVNLATHAVTNVGVGLGPVGIVRSPDGSAVYVVSANNSLVYRIATANNAVTSGYTHGPVPFGVSLTPDGSRLYISHGNSGTVAVLNPSTLALITTIPVGSGAYVAGQFISPPAPQPVPTMTEWAMILLGLILAGGAAVVIQRRRLVI